jgi:hypothetical protein
MNIDQQVAKLLRDNHGWELTPKQVREERAKAYAKIRQHLKDRGHIPPESDSELREWIRQSMPGLNGQSR